jgi:uncharacterized tellurite resistance protein B-like protein
MHILAALGAVLGVLLFVLFRMQQAANAARDVADAAEEARGLFRRWAWRRKHLKHPLDTIEDAREAAAAMMVVTAQFDGDITERERQAIAGEMVNRFGATAAQAEALLARARWLVKDRVDPAEVYRRLTPLIVRTCGTAERSELIEMLSGVAAADGTADEVLMQDVAKLAHNLRNAA